MSVADSNFHRLLVDLFIIADKELGGVYQQIFWMRKKKKN
jgi:hypothetical protein